MTPLQLAARRLLRNGKPPRRLKRQFAPRAPLEIERQYVRDLLPILESMRQHVRAEVLQRLPSIFKSHEMNRPKNVRNDAPGDELSRAFKQVYASVDQQWSEEEMRVLAQRKGMSLSAWNREVLKRNLKRVVGVDVLFADPFLAQELAVFTINNVNLISTMTQTGIGAVEQKAYAALQAGTRWEEVSAEIEKYLDPEDGPVRAKANLIARDQISKLNGQLNMLRQNDLGITRYRWRTVGDDRVRETHAHNDGQIFDWDDPPATGHPGEDYQCRCWAEPVLEDLVPGMVIDEAA